jgi:hypothetical protein
MTGEPVLKVGDRVRTRAGRTGVVVGFPSHQGYDAVQVRFDRVDPEFPLVQGQYPRRLLTVLTDEQLKFVCGPDDVDESGGVAGDVG